MNRLLSILLVCLLQINLAVASAFKINVEVTPDGSGSLNTSGGTYEEGSQIQLYAYINEGFIFKGWYEGDSLLSSERNYYYIMPAYNVLLQARYEYDPSVPDDPEMPDSTSRYRLITAISPFGAGSVSQLTETYVAGAHVYVDAYLNRGYRFLFWQDEKGNKLSTNAYFNYVIPNHDSKLTAVCEFNPDVPADPDSMGLKHHLIVKCKPEGSGTFNVSNEKWSGGKRVDLYAYTRNGFRFLHWEDINGNIVGQKVNYDFVMPEHDVQLYGVFEYDPEVPSNPRKNYWNKELGEVIVDDFEAGSLNSAITEVIEGSDYASVGQITVMGRVNDNDFGVINNYPQCTLLDMSRVAGVQKVPSYAFDNTQLENISLPATVDYIGYHAFYNCKNLVSLTCYAMLPPGLDNRVFEGVPTGLVVYVPASSVNQYQQAQGWKDFTIFPIQEDIRSLTVNLPRATNVSLYKQMWLELTNTKSGQKIHYVMSDRSSYVFSNIIKNTSWNVVLRNQNGDVFGSIENVEVKEEDVSVTFENLSTPKSVQLAVLDGNGKEVTNIVKVVWMDASGQYLSENAQLKNLAEGTRLKYAVELSEELSLLYQTPELTACTAGEANRIVCQLVRIPQVALSGRVIDQQTAAPIAGATINASQIFANKYNRTTATKTNEEGEFTLNLSDVPTTFIASYSDYISQSVVCDSFQKDTVEVRLKDFALKPISGAVVSVEFTFTKSKQEGQTPAVTEGYEDYNNVDYAIYNRTAGKPITKFNVQYPAIVLLEEVAEGDVLELTATSKKRSFNAVKATTAVNQQKGNVVFGIVEPGHVEATFNSTKNASVVGILYDANGKLLQTFDYVNGRIVTPVLSDGNYSLVTMGNSRLLNTIFDLNEYAETGLTEGNDYVLNSFEVKSGLVAAVKIDAVPYLDESKFYYTGDQTLFMVNKPNIVVGNFLTFSGRVDFKKAYAKEVKNVRLIVDIPETCSFVENSIMVGNSLSGYSVDNHRIVVPMTYYTDRVRFCVIPTLGGEYAPSAFVQFELGGETFTQPIGSAPFVAKDLSIAVSRVVAKTNVPIHGTAQGSSDIEIYDNGVLIGQTRSRANGEWATKCELFEPKNLSEHAIYAKVTTKKGLKLISETVNCTYNKDAIEVDNVIMLNVAHPSSSLNLCEYVSRFDFQNPSESMEPYWYWPAYPDFTFLIEFTSNDTLRVDNVRVNVKLSDGKSVFVPAKFDAKQEKWVAKAKFQSESLPVNVAVSFHSYVYDFSDNESLSKFYKEVVGDSLRGYIRNIKNGYAVRLVDKNENPYGYVIDCKVPRRDIGQYQSLMLRQGFKYMDEVKTVNFYQKENSYALMATPKDSISFFFFYDPQDKSYFDEWTKSEVSLFEVRPASNLLERARDRQIQGWLDMATQKTTCADEIGEIELEGAVRRLRNSVTFINASFLGSIISVTNSTSNPSGNAAERTIGYATTLSDTYESVSQFAPGVEGLNRSALAAIEKIKNAPVCGPGPGDDNNDNEEEYPGSGPGHVMDPSGYVYEAVSSNRLKGVTATCYYKEMVEDIYGDLHENIVKWNAEEYAQKNPLFTDENGMYAWDVPQGLWQVRFEKEGYENTQSEWLPVPPPQLEINIEMKQNRQPEVKAAKAFESAVEVEFDKYMMTEDLNADNIFVLIDNLPVAGKLTLLDAEESYENSGQTFASKVRFDAVEPFASDGVSLMISNRVKSYAGIRMQDDFIQHFGIEPEVQKIVCDSVALVGYGHSAELSVKALPAIAAAGKVVRIANSSRMVLGLATDSVVLDGDGKAVIAVTGELPGTSALAFTIDGYDLNAATVVNVEQLDIEAVVNPIASVPSGSEVESGTKIYLSCATKGAVIYYTLDGSCPCIPSAAVKTYDGTPIVVNESVEIKAMAVLEGMTESEVVTYIYTVIPTAIEKNEAPVAEIYPNVVKQFVNIDIPQGKQADVVVVSVAGYMVYQEPCAAGHLKVNMTGLKPGFYVVAVKDKYRKLVVKIIKVNG